MNLGEDLENADLMNTLDPLLVPVLDENQGTIGVDHELTT